MRRSRPIHAVVLASLLVTAPAGSALAADSGFTPVRTLQGEPVSIAAVSRSDVWSASRADNGNVRLERISGSASSVQTLPVPAGADLAVHGSGTGDVWLVSSGQLWHFTAGKWARTTLPSGHTATAVFDVSGKNAYVATYAMQTGGGFTQPVAYLFRYNGTTWTSLGGPELADNRWEFAGTENIDRIQVAGGKVFAETTQRPPASSVFWRAYQVNGTTWTQFATTGSIGGGDGSRSPGWVVNGAQHLFFGQSHTIGSNPQPQAPLCSTVVPGQNSQSCATTAAAGDAGRLSNGAAVIGGVDYRASWLGAEPVVTTQATFVLRTKKGAERTLTGDPGEGTIKISVAPGSNVAYALTHTGSRYVLQRYRG